MKCLHCGKIIGDSASQHEKKSQWHKKCIKNFFGTDKMPLIEISKEKLEEIANATVNKGLTVPGVQKKLSLHLEKGENERLTIVDYPTGYILKPQTEEFEALPEAEDLCMRMAEKAGIKTVPHALIKINKENGELAYITRRIDRNFSDGSKDMQMYAMEDFCQLSNRLTQDKYRGSYEKCAKIIYDYSSRVGLDLSELFFRVVFSFITGNSDMHLKNFSMIEKESGKREFVISQAYDLLPVNIILPEDEEEFALTLNGKKKNIRRNDFIKFAENCNISKKAAENILKKLTSLEIDFIEMCDNSMLSEELKESFKKLIRERIAIIK